MLNIKFTLSSGGGLARNIWYMAEIAAFTVKSASSANTGLACYGYIKQSTMIDKLSLRLGRGGSCVNIIMMLSVTLTPL